MSKIIHYAIVVMVTTSVAAGILAALDYATMDRIAEMDRKTQTEARKSALSDAVKFDETKTLKSGNSSFIPGFDEKGILTGYVTTVTSPGYGAKGIVFVLGIGKDGKIKGLKITDATGETPGLGSNVMKESWQEHWKGKDKSYIFEKLVDGFAGATISPKGVYTGITDALKNFEDIKGAAK